LTSCLGILSRHDHSYRLFFNHRSMIQDFLTEIVDAPWVDRLDLASGELVNGLLIHKQHQSRTADTIWKFRRKDGQPGDVYILLEFQSRPDPTMPVRFMGYDGLFLQLLLDSKVVSCRDKLPPVIPVVLYNGVRSWNKGTELGALVADLDPSAEHYRPQLRFLLVDERRFPRERLEALNGPAANLIRIEQSRDWSEARANIRRLSQSVQDPSLREAFATWLRRVILPRFGIREELSAHLNLEDFEAMESMLARSIDRWNRQIRKEGMQEGMQKGEAQLLLRQLRLKLGPLSPEVENRILAADSNHLVKWSERILTAERLEDVFGEKR
jgi:predicted transposase YdaD